MKQLSNISLFVLLACSLPFISIAQGATSPVTIAASGAVSVGSTTTFADANDGGIWSSSDKSVAAVSKDGIVTGVTTGNATISYAYVNDAFALVIDAVTVAVNAAPAASGITATAASVPVGATTSLMDKNAGGIWSSSDKSVATVNENGTVTGVTAGTVTITYAYTDDSFAMVMNTATIKVASAIALDDDYKVLSSK